MSDHEGSYVEPAGPSSYDLDAHCPTGYIAKFAQSNAHGGRLTVGTFLEPVERREGASAVPDGPLEEVWKPS